MTTDRSKLTLLLLAALLLLAFILRFRGIWFGYPLSLHPDEPGLVGNALRILQTGDLNPHFFNYPSLNIYLQALVYKATSLGSGLLNGRTADIPTIQLYLAGRLFNVLLSVLTLAVTYDIGRRLFSPLAGLAAVFFATFSFLHLANSFVVTVDTSTALWATLATLMAVLIYTRGKRLAYYVLGGVFVGLAVSSKYTAFVAFAPILLAHFEQSRKDGRWLDRNIVFSAMAVPLAFVLTMPYAVLDYDNFIEAIRFESDHYRTGHAGAESPGSTSFALYLRYLLTTGYGLLPSILSLLGFIWLLAKKPSAAVLLSATPLLLFLFVGQYKVYFPRNIVAVVPFLALFGGFFVAAVYDWLIGNVALFERSKWATVLLIAAILIGSVYSQAALGLDYVRQITLPDTRWESIGWIEQNLPAGARIGREHYTPPLEEYAPQFDVSYLGYRALVGNPDQVKAQDHMIVSSQDYGRFFNTPGQYAAERAAYEAFFAENELVHEFVPDGVTLGGPTIRIYRIGKQELEN